MNIQEPNRDLTQNEIQKVLEDYNLQLAKDINLEYIKPKYFNYQVLADCKICEKRK